MADIGRPTPPRSVGAPEMGLGPAWMKPVKVPRLTPDGRVLGGRRRRVVAYLVDVVLLVVVAFGIDALIGAPSSRPTDAATALVLVALNSLVMLVYQVGLWTGGRSTVGMRLLGLRVVSAVDGAPVRVGAALRRWLVLEGVGQLLGVAGIVAAALAFGTADTVITLLLFGWIILLLATTTADERRQGLHDKVARTYVVRR